MEDSTAIDQDAYREAAFKGGEYSGPVDAKNRPLPEAMTDREIAEETLKWLRGFADALESAGENPMLRAMIPSLRK